MWNRIGAKYGNNHIVAAAFPNDPDGNAFRAVFPPIAEGRGLHDRPVDGVHRRADQLHVDDHRSSRRQGRLLHQRAAAARLRHHVEAGAAAGLPARSSPPSPRCCCSRPTPTRWARRSTTSPPTPGGCRPCRGHSSFTGQTCMELADLYTSDGIGQPNANISNYTPLRDRLQGASPRSTTRTTTHEVAAALFKVNLPQAVAGPMTSPRATEEPRAWRRDHPAGRHPVAEGHHLPARGQGRRQHAAAAGEDHRRPAADLLVSVGCRLVCAGSDEHSIA